MPLTPEQQALRLAMQAYLDNATFETSYAAKSAVKPELILSILAQLEAQEAPSLMDNLRKNDPAFAAHLDRCSAEVATWPRWKRMGYGEASDADKLHAIRNEYDEYMADSSAQQFGVSFADWKLRYKVKPSAPVASPPGSAGSREHNITAAFVKWAETFYRNQAEYTPHEYDHGLNAWKAAIEWAALSQPVQAVPDERLQKVREALETYYKALIARQHGGSAQADAIYSIEQAMGMTWMDWTAAQHAAAPGGLSQ